MNANRTILVSLFAVAAAMAAQVPVARADLAAKQTFSIPPQPLSSALIQFSKQADVQVVGSGDTLSGLKTSGVTGEYTGREALKALLGGNALTFQEVTVRSVRILRPSAGVKALKLAAVETDIATAAAAEEKSAENVGKEENDARGVPEILVKGKRSSNTDIQRTEDDPQPYVVFGQEEIARSQAVNLMEFLNTRLPMNTSEGSLSQAISGSFTQSRSSVNLRGLGENQTLILVDGRRMPGLALAGNPLQPDVNGIPLSAIERIEILPSTAGGIYGGSATGGVINIVLRRDFRGLEADVNYGNTFDTDVANVRFDLNGGFSLEGGRTHVMLTAAHAESNTLTLGDRDFSVRSVALQRANNPVAVVNGLPLGGTVNIRSAVIVGGVRQPLVLDSAYGGGALGSAVTHLPLGYAGPASDNGAALVANAGRYNLDLPNDLNGRGRGLMSAPSMDSFSANIRREFTSRLDIFLDVSRLGSKGQAFMAGVPNFVSNLPAGAPNNPFQQNIDVRYPTPGLSFESSSESVTLRGTAGVIARLPREWTAEADYSWSRSRFSGFGASSLIDDAAVDSLGNGLPAPDGRPALNALQEANTFPIDFTPYRMDTPNQIFGPYDTVLKDATLRLSGPVLRLPGGPLNLSALLERREEEIADGFLQDTNSSTREATYFYFPRRFQNADSMYLEARAPLVSAANARPLARELELQVSARRDRYATYNGPFGFGIPIDSPQGPFPPLEYRTSRLASTDYTFGLRYAPTEDLALRVSYGTGFLPPAVTQIVSSLLEFDFPLGYSDPKRGNTDTYVGQPYDYIYGGNSNLSPERSRSWSAGVIITPRMAPQLRLSIDYTHIGKIDEIQPLSEAVLIANEALFPGRIQRGPNLPGDLPGWAGPITSIDVSYFNVARTELRAYDLQADYTVESGRFGDFRWYALASWQPHYRSRVLPTAPTLDNVGFNNGILEWRGNVGLDWRRGDLSVGWNAQYYHSYLAYFVTSEDFERNQVVRNQGSDTIPSQMYHDLVASYRLDDAASFAGGWLANSELSLGIQNLFDKLPPILATTGPTNGMGYSGYGDPRLRRYTISLRKSFQ